MKSMDLLFHVFKWISTAKNDKINVRPLRKLPENVLTLLWSTLNPIVSDASAESLNNTVWFGSVAFANTLFTLLQWALKAGERVGRPQVSPLRSVFLINDADRKTPCVFFILILSFCSVD